MRPKVCIFRATSFSPWPAAIAILDQNIHGGQDGLLPSAYLKSNPPSARPVNRTEIRAVSEIKTPPLGVGQSGCGERPPRGCSTIHGEMN